MNENTAEKLQGEDIPAPDFPAELMTQAEEASRAFIKQAEQATKAMQRIIDGEEIGE